MNHPSPLKKYIFRTLIFFTAWFFLVAVISYYVLPEGLLRSANEAKDICEETSLLTLTIATLVRNLIPAFGLCAGCLVSIRIKNDSYPFAYIGLFTMFTINGVTLGTWSFSSMQGDAPSLFVRLLRSFDLIHRSGLWEMVGLCLLVAAFTNAAIIQIVDGKPVINTQNFKLSKSEVLCFVCGLMLMAVAAVVESNAVIVGM